MQAPETLTTPRLVLRRPEPADVEAIFGYASDPEVTRLLGWPCHTTVADTHGFLRFSDEAWAAGPGPYVVIDADGAVVGSTGLEVETPHRAATGYVLARRAWGRGYATEVATAMAELAADLGIERLYALCHPENRASGGCWRRRASPAEAVLRRHTVFPNLDPTAAQDVECWVRLMVARPPVLTTERLVLRGIVPEDAADLFAFRSDQVEQRYNDPPLRTLGEAHDLIRRLDRERREYGAQHWGVTLVGGDRVVGLLGYNEIVTEHRRASLGYDLARRLWGRGLATEALTAVLGHGFDTLGLNRVEAHTDAANASSIRLLRRLGFWQEGTFHDRFREDDGYHDIALYVLLRRNR